MCEIILALNKANRQKNLINGVVGYEGCERGANATCNGCFRSALKNDKKSYK